MTEAEFLKSYNLKDYDAPLCTVDSVVLMVEDGTLKVLLIKRSDHPHKDRWALPGGFCDLTKDATIDATAHRKLVEKTGVRSPYLEQVESIGNANRDPRGWSITLLYLALIDFNALDAGVPMDSARWMSISDALKCDLAFDHNILLRKAINRMRSKTRYTALPVNLMPESFTLTELQTIFELILSHPLQKKSFRRRIEASKLLVETGEMRSTSRRPAALFERAKAFEEDHIFPGLLDVPLETL
ncbi:NUDIX hydrolase [Hellea sp.]|nr:NUDIX hydrolase [Hellea sp.]MDA8708613.1 NUDIX hydrolase [Hellea sp.]